MDNRNSINDLKLKSFAIVFGILRACLHVIGRFFKESKKMKRGFLWFFDFAYPRSIRLSLFLDLQANVASSRNQNKRSLNRFINTRWKQLQFPVSLQCMKWRLWKWVNQAMNMTNDFSQEHSPQIKRNRCIVSHLEVYVCLLHPWCFCSLLLLQKAVTRHSVHVPPTKIIPNKPSNHLLIAQSVPSWNQKIWKGISNFYYSSYFFFVSRAVLGWILPFSNCFHRNICLLCTFF